MCAEQGSGGTSPTPTEFGPISYTRLREACVSTRPPTPSRQVLKDLCNPSRTLNIVGLPLTQTDLKRVDANSHMYADQALRETVRRLIGGRPGARQLEERIDIKNINQVQAWADMAAYLTGRIQSTPEHKPGREPDMSAAAGMAIRAVLAEVGHMPIAATCAASSGHWQALAKALGQADGGFQGRPVVPLDVAVDHTVQAREEAARALISNHVNVLKDVTNPSKELNIIGNALTQTELKRVSIGSVIYADEALRETARRLLGRRAGLEEPFARVDLSNDAQVVAWCETADYLDGRIHSHTAQKPGREPDMSPPAAAAMKAVLKEIAAVPITAAIEASGAEWSMLRQLLEMRNSGPSLLGKVSVEGAAACHSQAARDAAARKLIQNHVRVLYDVVDPAPITQTNLTRVSRAAALHVDAGLREVARRLLGRRTGSPEAFMLDTMLTVSIDNNPARAKAWLGMADYLDKRLHAEPEDCPTRKPDMPSDAGKAMRAVLKEVGVGQSLSGGLMPGSMLLDGVLGHKDIEVGSFTRKKKAPAKKGGCAIL